MNLPRYIVEKRNGTIYYYYLKRAALTNQDLTYAINETGPYVDMNLSYMVLNKLGIFSGVRDNFSIILVNNGKVQIVRENIYIYGKNIIHAYNWLHSDHPHLILLCMLDYYKPIASADVVKNPEKRHEIIRACEIMYIVEKYLKAGIDSDTAYIINKLFS
jgi:hypothetical protein